ncbi:hypothetical protein QQF64_034048 [Cirrhinus molitorella]|uniref:Uncharacterized protein n=1 Tax=Cirrhinus molitorella TaxID=172907 RepID=A0ABR3MVK6_9TELE
MQEEWFNMLSESPSTKAWTELAKTRSHDTLPRVRLPPWLCKGVCAKCPKALTSTRLRKHAATLSTVLNMTDTEMDQLANFLGHDIRIHREFYRCLRRPCNLPKSAKVLMALEQGRLAEFHGKNLDEIGIDPDEPSAEMALPSAERNTSPPPKRSKPSKQMPSGASAMRLPCKGKTTQKRTPWQQTEVQAVERHLKRFIISGTVPAKSDCEKCLRAEPEALRNRDWKTVKFYVYNRITAYKKKLQCR